jgi:chromosome segregation ATPase
MKTGIGRTATASVLLLAALFVVMPEARSQGRTTRPSRRQTNPVRPASVPLPTPLPTATPNTSEPRLVSSAEDVAAQEEAQQQPPRQTPRRTAGRQRRGTDAEQQETEQEQLRRTVNRLSDQVTRLSEDMSAIKDEQRTLVDLERLSRAETRAEGLRAQLRDVMDKEFALQERTAQIEDELQPDAIERRAALIGSTRPAEVRDQIRRSLERERDRVRVQLEMLTNSRARLESAIVTAEAEVEKLKQRIDASDREANAEGRTTNPVPLPATTPPATDATTPEPPLF